MRHSHEDFEACLEQGFELLLDDGNEPLRLIQVDRLEQAQTLQGRKAFSIIFHSASQDVLPQQIYTLSHPELGQFELFLVPIGQDEAGTRYEAVFS